ncbi:transglutaminase N-terminal domain-containing protein [Xanthobacteraceae bacterium A53D]
MLYDIRQTTSYSYAGPVRATRQVLRLSPVDRHGHQQVQLHALDVSPRPSELERGLDFFGNGIAWLVMDAPHDRLEITTRSRVDVNVAQVPDPAATPGVAQVREEAMASTDLGPASPVHGLYASRSVPLDPAITDWVGQSCPDERPVLEAAMEVMTRIHADFAYQPGTTTVTTLPAEAFAARSGVCQDFAHVMIAGLRGLGLAARYVSGYLRTVPPEGEARLEGADATHAWAEVWCGHQIGWIGLDPTNAIPAGEDHVILAVGRDYADVSPVDGVMVASGGQILAVGVDVIPVERSQADAPAS